MKTCAAFLTAMLLGLSAMAETQLRDVQTELKNQGFYYGELDGQDSAETSSAIRRYQIRNGLAVTGKINDETLAALGFAPPKKPETAKRTPGKEAPAQVNPPTTGNDAPTARPRQDLLREREQPGGQPGTDPNYDPTDPAVVTPPTRIPPAVEDDYTVFFHGTPYASAPVTVQFETVRKAQSLLMRRGVYEGSLNGLPGTLTSDALFRYQEQRRLPRTGRLDLRTLADLNLLPNRGELEAPLGRPFTDPSRRRDPSVDYRGLIR
jgi:peptidoglycan hydrolase-like protein with peptidoglycan-binding domain